MLRAALLILLLTALQVLPGPPVGTVAGGAAHACHAAGPHAANTAPDICDDRDGLACAIACATLAGCGVGGGLAPAAGGATVMRRITALRPWPAAGMLRAGRSPPPEQPPPRPA